MPFKSEKQRRWMYANKPAMARKWQSEYYNSGGKVTPDIEAEQLLEEFNANRQAVLFLQEGGKVNDLTDEQVYAAAEEAGIELVWRNGREKSVSELKYALRTKLSNEALTETLNIVLGKSDSEKVRRNRFHAEYTRLRNEGELQDVKFPEWFEQVKDDPDYAHITGESATDVKTIIGTLIDFTPILGDIKALFEAAAAWIKGNKLEAGLLAGAAAIGLVPGAGDAFAALMKRAAKIVGRTFSKIARGVENAVGTDGAAALGGEMSEAAGKAAIEIVGGADEASVIEKHIAELIAIARSRGFEVKRSDDYQYEHFGARGGRDGQPVSYSKEASDRIKPYINIPEGSTQGEYVIALEEFAHALGTGTRKIPGEIGVLTSEARAKLAAIKEARVPLTPEVMQQVADTYSNYLGLIVRAYDARRMDVFNELVDGLPPANDKIWDLLNSDKFEYVSAAGLRGRNQEKHIKDLREHVQAAEGRLIERDKPSLRDADPEDRDVASDAARVAKPVKIYALIDGEVHEIGDLTAKQLVDNYGASAGQLKKSDGSGFLTLEDGTKVKWNKHGDFKDSAVKQSEDTAKVTNAAPEDYVDPATIEFKGAGESRRTLPTAKEGATPALKKQIELEIYQSINDTMDEWIKRYPTYDVAHSGVAYMDGGEFDWEKTRELTNYIQNEGWDEIVQKMEKYKEYGPDFYEKVLKFAKQKTKWVWYGEDYGTPSAIEKLEELKKYESAVETGSWVGDVKLTQRLAEVDNWFKTKFKADSPKDFSLNTGEFSKFYKNLNDSEKAAALAEFRKRMSNTLTTEQMDALDPLVDLLSKRGDIIDPEEAERLKSSASYAVIESSYDYNTREAYKARRNYALAYKAAKRYPNWSVETLTRWLGAPELLVYRGNKSEEFILPRLPHPLTGKVLKAGEKYNGRLLKRYEKTPEEFARESLGEYADIFRPFLPSNLRGKI